MLTQWLRLRLRAWVALVCACWLLCPSVRLWGAVQPCVADAATLHLWHLNESATPCVDSAPGGTNLTALAAGAVLGAAPASVSFTNCLSAVDGGQNAFGGSSSDAVLTTLGVNSSAVIQYCDATTGAFTYEALLHVEFDPTKNLGASSLGGNGRNTPLQILNADGNANALRMFQLRIDPIGFQAFTGDPSSNVVRLEFINLNQGSGVQSILTPIPTTGADAIASNNWYHVGVSYSGAANVAGNLRFYWTLLDTNRTQATLIDGSETMTSSLAGSANPTVFTVGNAGRNPGGNASNPLNANFLGRIDEVRISRVARSAADMVFVSTNVSLTSQPVPASQLIGTGQPFSLSVAAAGAQPLSYQWRHNSRPTPAATGSSFSVAATEPSDSGTYDVVVTNSFSSITSSAVTVTVTNLAITSQPASVVAAYSSTATFVVGAVGALPLSYQWRKEGSPIAGATNSTLALTSLGAADAGSYDVVVANNLSSLISATAALALGGPQVTLTPISDGTPGVSGFAYAGSSGINAVAFICSGLATVGNQQFAVYYGRHQTDPSYIWNNTVWVARRTVGAALWQIFRTGFTANDTTSTDITDGHDVAAFGIDGSGYMHLSWGMHNASLHYARSVSPVTGTQPIAFGSDLGTMTGTETSVTYPQFLPLPNGDLLFLYRVGASGGGDTWMNRWSVACQSWTNVNISGGTPIQFIKGLWPTVNYNAYPNMPCLDAMGNLYLVWTWRETSAYESNHDLNFAKSTDAGVTWQRFDGMPYDLPISKSGENGDPATIAQVVVGIPQNYSLINQAGMCLDASNNPVLATWWAPGSATNNYRRQYMVAFPNANGVWQTRQVSNRTNDAPGTLMLDSTVRDLGRPVVVCDRQNRIIVLYRDNSASNGLTVAYSLPYSLDPQRTNWSMLDLTTGNLGNYEPVIDLARWQQDNVLDILYQASAGEGYTPPANIASPMSVMEWNAAAYFAPHPELRLAITNSGTDVLLSWNSQPGWGYRVQSSTDLVNWNPAATLTGIGGLLPLQYTQTNGALGPQRFWRLQVKEGGF